MSQSSEETIHRKHTTCISIWQDVQHYLSLGKCKLKPRMYHYTHIRMTKIPKFDKTNGWGDANQQELSFYASRNTNYNSNFARNWQFLRKLKSLTIWLIYHTHRYLSNHFENLCPYENQQVNLYSSFTHDYLKSGSNW